jgi:hypothetical protein
MYVFLFLIMVIKKMMEIPFEENDAHYWKRYY